MANAQQVTWDQFKQYYHRWADLALSLDLSRMQCPLDFLEQMAKPMRLVFAAMAELEQGAIANPDENRMVGHYWLRNPQLAPSPEIRGAIEDTLARIRQFAGEVHSGRIKGANGPFRHLLLIGIGGSALGPQFVAQALGQPDTDKLQLHCLDNTDPDGMDRALSRLRSELGQTLCVVISKSGGTKETRNGMVETHQAYERAGLSFAQHAIAITQNGSTLDKLADSARWLARFPMWDWVGGRTSETSAVGLLPAALQGFDIDGLLRGAKACDEATRRPSIPDNPAAQLALMWYYAGNGRGDRDMVVIPYKDRLELFSKYLQQLIMESLGKGLDSDGRVVNQGIAVYGNKGSTDQHAYVQQLREGLENFFVIFIQVLKERAEPIRFVEHQITSGDYLHGFYLGTRQALHENGRPSLTLTIESVSAYSVGLLIALFERAVGFYASLVGINAYHQPGVEAGKKAAEAVLDLERRLFELLQKGGQKPVKVSDLAQRLDSAAQVETLFHLCEHLAANGRIRRSNAQNPFEAAYSSI
jgi:glucose-6-phosphate isomerase